MSTVYSDVTYYVSTSACNCQYVTYEKPGMEKQTGLSSNSNLEPLDGAGDEVQALDGRSTAAHATASWTYSGCAWEGTAKKTVLCAVIVVVWMVLALPTVMFYVPRAQVLP